jgi:hypothetical protein
MRSKTSLKVMVFVLLVSSALGSQAIGIVTATVPHVSFIYVNSPQTGKTYFSNDIQLNFTIVPNMGSNFTSFSYSIDGQANQTTDGNAILTALAPGTHTLQIHGNGTYLVGNTIHDFRYALEAVYFGVFFSTESVMLTIIIGTAFLIVGLILLKKRRQLVRALKGKKTAGFWIGMVLFSFAMCFFVLALWPIAYDYLFWYYSRDYSTTYISIIGIFVGLVSATVGLYLMRAGTKSRLTLENK